MHQRFCSCGCVVWVQYLFHQVNCQIIFRSRGDRMEDYLTRCPCCGKKLDINELKY